LRLSFATHDTTNSAEFVKIRAFMIRIIVLGAYSFHIGSVQRGRNQEWGAREGPGGRV